MDERPDYAGIVARARTGEYYTSAPPKPSYGPTSLPYRPPPPAAPYDRFYRRGDDGYWHLFVPPLPRDEALAVLRAMGTDKASWHDPEANHVIADELLLHLLDDAEITEAFGEISMWYS